MSAMSPKQREIIRREMAYNEPPHKHTSLTALVRNDVPHFYTSVPTARAVIDPRQIARDQLRLHAFHRAALAGGVPQIPGVPSGVRDIIIAGQSPMVVPATPIHKPQPWRNLAIFLFVVLIIGAVFFRIRRGRSSS
jgi:hypothetical protein